MRRNSKQTLLKRGQNQVKNLKQVSFHYCEKSNQKAALNITLKKIPKNLNYIPITTGKKSLRNAKIF